jgi:hypothetical protein
MVEADKIISIITLIGAAVLAASFGKSKWCQFKRRGVQEPPKNTAADVARETVQQTFEEEVAHVNAAVGGDDPAGDLADQGNARRRR